MLSLHLYTVDPVDVYFQRENSRTKDLLCKHDKCSQNWKYVDRTKKIDLDGVMREHLGTYTVTDRVRGEIFCTYIVTLESTSRDEKHQHIHNSCMPCIPEINNRLVYLIVLFLFFFGGELSF